MTFRRTTTREVELHGERLPAGEKVVLFYHSANRDERAFEDPWRFDVAATPTVISVSAAAARTTAWAPRWRERSCARSSASCCGSSRDIEAQEPELLRSAFVHGVKRMDCEFRPGA